MYSRYKLRTFLCRESKTLVTGTKSQGTGATTNCIFKVTKGMGGVDLLDQGIAAYRTRIRQNKWWWPIFIYLFDACVVNAWLLNRKPLPADSAIHQLPKFRREIKEELAVTLLQKYGKPSYQRSQPKPLQGVRYDNTGHWPVVNATERRCGNCPGKAKFICSKCNIGLHPKCFQQYHTN